MASSAHSHEERVIQATASSSAEASEKKSKSDWCLGLFFVFLVCLLWASGSIIVQFVADDIGYNRPFVFTYIGSGVISGLVPSYLVLSLLGLARNPPLREEGGRKDGGLEYEELAAASDTNESGDADTDAGTAALPQQPNAGEEEAENRLLGTSDGRVAASNGSVRRAPEVLNTTGVVVAGSDPVVRDPLKSHLFMFKIGLSLSVVWYLSQWSYAASLGYTSVSSSTIISNSGALFAYLFNVAAGSERFTKTKTAGVLLALSGAAMVGLGDKGDDDASKDSVWGDAAALAAAVGYGVYTTILRVKSPSDDEVSMSLVLGYMGCANVMIFLPLLVGLALLPGVNALQGLTWHVVQLIVIRAVMENLFSELLWARAILLTTPTVATVGCSMTIPMAFASDFILHGIVPHGLAVLGSLLVVAGFCFVIDREESVGGVGDGGGHGGAGGGGGGSGAACPSVRNRRCWCLRFRPTKAGERCSPPPSSSPSSIARDTA
eukprot:g8324.t1